MVSWNDAAEIKLSVLSDDLVIPRRIAAPLAGFFLFLITLHKILLACIKFDVNYFQNY